MVDAGLLNRRGPAQEEIRQTESRNLAGEREASRGGPVRRRGDGRVDEVETRPDLVRAAHLAEVVGRLVRLGRDVPGIGVLAADREPGGHGHADEPIDERRHRDAEVADIEEAHVILRDVRVVVRHTERVDRVRAKQVRIAHDHRVHRVIERRVAIGDRVLVGIGIRLRAEVRELIAPEDRMGVVRLVVGAADGDVLRSLVQPIEQRLAAVIARRRQLLRQRERGG